MFKKINIKILYATIALTFSINLLIDGFIMRGIREGDSCRVFAERILKEYPLNKKNVYVVNNLRIYRNLYGLNFYMGNIFHDFDKETPAKGYFLIGENEMEKVLSTYGDKYTFRTLTKSDQTFSELKQKIVLSEFELK